MNKRHLYDGKVTSLAGPFLASVVGMAGVASGSDAMLALRAIDGCVVPLSLDAARGYRMIVATEMDGRPLALGGLGPQWAVSGPSMRRTRCRRSRTSRSRNGSPSAPGASAA